jgi:hypothetical protein
MIGEANDGPIDLVPQGTEPGEPIELFRPMTANIVAGFIIAAIMIIAGVAFIGFPLRGAYQAHWNLPFKVDKGWCWLAVGLFNVLGVGLVVGGVMLSAYSKRLISSWTEVSPDGFRNCWRGDLASVRWADVSRIKETILHERPPVLKAPANMLLPTVASRSYTITTKEGKEYGFDGNSIKAIKRFGKRLHQEAERIGLPWETVEERR